MAVLARSRDRLRCSEKFWIKSQLQQNLGVRPEQILFCDHHMSHAASAFFASPYEEAAVMTVDGVGEWTTTTMGTATAQLGTAGQNKIDLFWEQRFPHSIGLLYSAFTAFLGFEVNEGEYKVMGMSPYGEPNYVDQVKKLVNLNEDGSFELNMDYFAYHYSATQSFNSKFTELFGEPRVHGGDFFTAKSAPQRTGEKEAMQRNQYYADVAASIQVVTEDVAGQHGERAVRAHQGQISGDGGRRGAQQRGELQDPDRNAV